MSATDNHNRKAGLALLKSGLATKAEVARLAGVSRNAVQKWANAAELDCEHARNLYLAKIWARQIYRRS